MSDESGHGRTVGDLAQEILDLLVADPNFRQKLLDKPVETLAETGYPVSEEVSGYALMRQHVMADVTTAISCPPNCQIGKPPGFHTRPPAPTNSGLPRKAANEGPSADSRLTNKE